MIGNEPQTDLYKLLGVPRDASDNEVRAAYNWLRDLYSHERMGDAAPEFQEQAAAKRQVLREAFATLSDPVQRRAYDQQIGAASSNIRAERAGPALLDYRPLPPARKQERAVVAEARPQQATEQPGIRSGWRAWLPMILVALLLLGVLLVIVLSPVRAASGPAAIATPVLRSVQLPFTDQQLRQFRAAAEQTNVPENWIALGNALFDNLQTMRENAPQAPQYRNSLNDWLAVADAYERALQAVDDPVVRSDRAVALLNYGLDAPAEARVREAVAVVEQGIRANVEAPRALLNYGLILANAQPPRTADALAQWRRIPAIAPEAPEAARAQQLIEVYGR